MKKIVIVSLSAAILACAQNSNTIGLGVISLEQPYKGAKSRVLVLPYFEARYNGFYFRGLECGFEQKIDGEFGVGAFVKARLDGYESSDSQYLEGMQNRKDALEAGIRGSFGNHQAGKVSIFVSNDISNTHKGYELGIEYSKSFLQGNSSFTPFVSLKRESEKLTNYYYGVRQSESTPLREQYSTNGATNAQVGIRYGYKLSENIAITSMATYGRFDESIHKSPIVNQKDQTKLFVGCGYKF